MPLNETMETHAAPKKQQKSVAATQQNMNLLIEQHHSD